MRQMSVAGRKVLNRLLLHFSTCNRQKTARRRVLPNPPSWLRKQRSSANSVDMASQSYRHFALNSTNAIPFPASSKPLDKSAQFRPAHRAAGLANSAPQKSSSLIAQNATKVPSDASAVTQKNPMPYGLSSATVSTPSDLTEFENAQLIHQKQLKANNSQITRVTLEFSELKARYLTTLTIPPTTTAAFRDHILSQLRSLCTRHTGLLNLRREMLQKQQVWLENSMDVRPIRGSDRLLMAIDMQIGAAQDLAERHQQGSLMQDLAWI